MEAALAVSFFLTASYIGSFLIMTTSREIRVPPFPAERRIFSFSKPIFHTRFAENLRRQGMDKTRPPYFDPDLHSLFVVR